MVSKQVKTVKQEAVSGQVSKGKAAKTEASTAAKTGNKEGHEALLSKIKGKPEAIAAALDEAFGGQDIEAACRLLAGLDVTPEIEAFVLPHLGKVLDAMGHKKVPIRQAGEAAWVKTAQLTVGAVSLELPALFAAMEQEKGWQTRTAALRRLEAVAQESPDAVAAWLPAVVPHVTPCLFDTKAAVATAAR